MNVVKLYNHIAQAAWHRMSNIGDIESTWSRVSGCLSRSIHFDDYNSALKFALDVNSNSSDIGHHPNLSINLKCANVVGVKVKYSSFEANDITHKVYEAARKVNRLLAKEANEKIQICDFTYNLRPESIAKHPTEPRGSSRLLYVDAYGNVRHFDTFSNSLLNLLDNSHVVFNQSKVVDARMSVHSFKGSKNDRIEMMILDSGVNLESSCENTELTVMIRKVGVDVGDEFIDSVEGSTSFTIENVLGPWIEDDKSQGNGTECIVRIQGFIGSVSSLLESVGSVPIPPYLNREANEQDKTAYNTVYASGDGSVAAPTAGLHFDDTLMEKIGYGNISFLSLHVGAGTFKPVVTEDAREHEMHGESFAVSVSEIQKIVEALENKKRLVVVGTTSLRTLESLFWCGVKRISEDRNDDQFNSQDADELLFGQHEWTDLKSLLVDEKSKITAIESLKALIKDKLSDETIRGRTRLMIIPGYEFKVVENLITNFHAPDSTLMLLVSVFLRNPEKVREVYEEAQDRGYRFLSYGDSCFLARPH